MDQNELDASDRYHFDAPNEVVDLAEFHNAPCDDNWFEKRESGSLGSTFCETQLEEVEACPPVEKAASPSNIVTSWGNSKPSTSTCSQPCRVPKRKLETSGPPVKKQRKSLEAQPLRKSSRIVKSKSLRVSQSASSLHKASAEMSSEELELERMKKLQEVVALHRKKNEASYKAALAGSQPAKKMAFTTTVPREFSFMTDARVKSTASCSATKEVNFVDQLRKPCSPSKTVRGATLPKPFNLSTSRKRKGEEHEPYVPIAQRIQQFEKKTPDRYHQPSRQTHERGPSPNKNAPHKPTVKEPTVSEGFQLQIEKRLKERQAKKPPVEEEEEPPHTFKSHPVSKKILQGVVGVPQKRLPSLTVPESPAFALRKRVRVEPAPAPAKPPSPIKAPPVPHFGLPFQPKLPDRHHVEVCPFSFDKREQERRALKEMKLEQMKSEEVPKFKAQPLPDFSTVVLPEKKKPELTKPEPFNLLIDSRGAEKTSRWENMVQEEKKQLEEATHFKARPNVVTRKEPFKPKRESADTSRAAAEPFQLLTERRAQERQEFDRLVSEKESLRALMEEQRRQQAEEQEREEVARLRQEQVHKAQPVKHYRCVKVKKSEMALTVPQSPNFSDRFHM